MPTPQQSSVLRDANNVPIPQVWSPEEESFQAAEGRGNSMTTNRGRWYVVGASATTTSIPLQTPSGNAISFSAATQSRLAGGVIEMQLTVSGTVTTCQAQISSVTSAGIVTPDTALPAAPAQGTACWISDPDPSALVQIGGQAPVVGKDSTDTQSPSTSGVQAVLGRLYGWTGTAWSRLKLATSGSLKTTDDSLTAAASGWGVTAAGSTITAGGWDATGKGRPLVTDTVGILATGAGLHTSQVIMQNAAVATGIGTKLPTIDTGGSTSFGVHFPTAVIEITGTFVATVTFQGVGPAGGTYTVNARNRTTGVIATTATAPGLYEVDARGVTGVYADITSYTSGSVSASGMAVAVPPATNQVALTGSNVGLAVINADTTLNAAQGAYDVVTITPPANTMYRVQALTLILPAQTGTGLYELFLQNLNGAMYLTNTQTGTAAWSLQQFTATGANNLLPANGPLLADAILSMLATPSLPLEVQIYNNTGASLSGTMTLRLTVQTVGITGN